MSMELSVEGAKTLVRRERSLEKVIKYESLVITGLDKKWNKDRIRFEMDKIFGTSVMNHVKPVIPTQTNGELVGHAYLNFQDR